jgi:hypothetical protein
MHSNAAAVTLIGWLKRGLLHRALQLAGTNPVISSCTRQHAAVQVL